MRVSRLIDCVEDAIIVIDERMQLRWHNRGFLKHFVTDGSTTEGLELARTASTLTTSAQPSSRSTSCSARPGGDGLLIVRVRRGTADGASDEWHPVEVIATNLLDDPDIGGLVCCFRDLTREESYRAALELQLSLAAANAELSRQLDERQSLLTRLVKLQTTISTSGPLGEVCEAICAAVFELLGDEMVSLRLVDADGDLDLYAARGVAVPRDRAERRRYAQQGIGGHAFASDTEQLAYDVGPGADDHATAALALPIRNDGRVVGSLTVGSRQQGRRFSVSERDVLRLLADHAADALAASRAKASIDLALTDELTGLPQRRAALDALQRLLEEHHERQEPLSLLFIDLDGFKTVNDSRGHEYGDRVLTEVARRLRNSTRGIDLCARLGGDEFLVICPTTGTSDAAQVGDRITRSIEQPFVIDDAPFFITTSIGIAGIDPVRDRPTSAEQLIRRADIAMYRGKMDGRSRVVAFDATMEAAAVARAERGHELRMAIANGDLDVAFQPVVRLADGSWVGHEALARWTIPQRGNVPPQEFVALAKTLGLERTLDLTIAELACTKLADAGTRGLLSINVSPPNLEDPTFAEELIDVAARTIGANRLVVEVLESSELSAAAAADTLRSLRANGVRIAIDDFGTGYSSLSYLESLPIDVIKLDRSFVAMLDGPTSGKLAEALLQVASVLAVDVIAEGVETHEQRERLHALGALYAQGYLFGAPEALAS